MKKWEWIIRLLDPSKSMSGFYVYYVCMCVCMYVINPHKLIRKIKVFIL